MAIDTLQLSKDLQVSFSPAQAETLAKALNHVVSGDLATKRDVQELKTELRSEIQIVRSEIKGLKAELIKWIAGALVVNVGLVVTLIKVIH